MRNWIIWYAIILHSIYGLLLIMSESTQNITALRLLIKFLCSSRIIGGSVIILAAGLAITGLLRENRSTLESFMFLAPQQALLSLSALGAINAIITSSFADGVIRPRTFILADQSPVIIAMVLHTFNVLDICARPFVENGKSWIVRKIRLINSGGG